MHVMICTCAHRALMSTYKYRLSAVVEQGPIAGWCFDTTQAVFTTVVASEQFKICAAEHDE